MKVAVKVSKWIGLRAIVVIVIYFIACFVLYRLPASSETEFLEGKVLYQLTETVATNRRVFEESLMQNRILRMKDNSMWYVSKSNHEKLWPEDPISMYKKGYTFKVKLKVKKLLFGGYSKAEVVKYNKINEKPTVWK
jgi:hypothetical protein